MKTIRYFFTTLMTLVFTLSIAQSSKSTDFKPLHIVICVPNVQEAAEWYIDKLDFESYQRFDVPTKGLSAQLLKKGDFELMLMKSDGSKSLPLSRKSTFTDLNVEGVKRIAFEVDDLDEFITNLQGKSVEVDVTPRLFEDKENQVSFKWAIIKDNNGNLLEFVEREKSSQKDIENFLGGWSKAWSPKENAANFDKESLRDFYVQSEELVAFDFTDSSQTTVIKGAENHHMFWEPFMRQFNYWTFTPDLGSLTIHTLTQETASISMYVDNYGRLADGTIIQAKAHVTLVLVKENNDWKIIHENIWGPVKE
ncbi:VOC family protein [Kordia jejudonensis]|uniref:VOC family protein n=1 Tax=Kordia jejudonensis TaxID=1348245 RepID=UPI00062900C6|nr:VOC family protein [Kordia jejudonensis]